MSGRERGTGQGVAIGRRTLTAAFIGYGLQSAGIGATLTVFQDEWRVSESTWGLVLGLALLVSIPGRMISANLLLRHGRLVAPTCYLVMAALVWTMPFAPELWVLGLVFALYMTAAGILNISLNAAGLHYEHLRGRQVLATLHGAYSLGGGVALVAVGVVLELTTSTLVLCGLFGALLAVCTSAFRDVSSGLGDDVPDQPTFSVDFSILHLPGVKLACAAGVAASFSEVAMYSWTLIHVRDQFGFTGLASVSGSAAFFFAMALGRLGFNPLVERFGRVRALLASGVATGIAMSIGLATDSPWVAIPAFLVVGLGCAVTVPAAFSLVGTLAPDRAVNAASISGTLASCAHVAAPVLIGVLAGMASLRAALLTVVVAGVTTAVSAGRLRTRLGIV